MRAVTWKKGIRFEREASFRLEAPKTAVFPLLCPVLEEKWLPLWSCTMVYSESGVAERDAVFTTREGHFMKATWTLITHEPDELVEYLIVGSKGMIVRLSIALRAVDGDRGTEVTWTMRFTLSSKAGAAIAHHGFGEAKFADMIERRRLQLAHYLRTGTMLEA
ncbi:MAG TPA: SRPBCC family protein [Rectinemataceae bacterium]|nr:SRPBCC family protein [Rectinemataceae bacterium]